MSGRKEKKRKEETLARARVPFLFRPSFSLHLISFVRRSFCRVFRFSCAATPIMIFDQFGELQNADACDFAERKKKKAARPVVRACGTADRTRTCALFILFPKVAKKRMCVIFVRVTRCGETGKKWKGKNAKQ